MEFAIGFLWIKFTNCKKVLLDVISMAYITAATSENPDPFCWNESLITARFFPRCMTIGPTPYSPTSYRLYYPRGWFRREFLGLCRKDSTCSAARFSLSFVYKWEFLTQESAGRAWRHAKSSNFCQIAKPTAASAVFIRVYTYKRDRLSRRTAEV